MKLIVVFLLIMAFRSHASEPALEPRVSTVDTQTTAVQWINMTHEQRLDNKLACHAKVEDWRWANRIWPVENVSTKPPRELVFPDREIESKVLELQAMESALYGLYGIQLEAEVQHEFKRILKSSKNKKGLFELLQLLNHDSILISECLIKPLLIKKHLKKHFDQYNKTKKQAESFAQWWQTAQFEWMHVTSDPIKPIQLNLALINEVNPNSAFNQSGILEGNWLIPELPSPRINHTAIWTGDEMIIWGGYDGDVMNTGSIYNPLTDSWRIMTMDNAPSPRRHHTAVWTGNAMLIWGGESHDQSLQTGSQYSPDTNQWTAISTTGAPVARTEHTTVWTGAEMIVWGGALEPGDFMGTKTGGRYNPSSNTWMDLPETGAPNSLVKRQAVWTGEEMLIYAPGNIDNIYRGGAKYNPQTNQWVGIDNNAGENYIDYTAVWTGDEMIIWGGWDVNGGGASEHGARYHPATDSWITISGAGNPTRRTNHSAIWTGSEMLIWGGNDGFGDAYIGGIYDPQTDQWTSLVGLSSRDGVSAVWTGDDMIIWGGQRYFNKDFISDGHRYNPVTSQWTTFASPNLIRKRAKHTTVWTGIEMLVWGGLNRFALSTGGVYDPVLDNWTEMDFLDAPDARIEHTAVWSGTQMIVWGGRVSTSSNFYFRTGGVYNPMLDTWSDTETNDAPFGRPDHGAFWVGDRMLIVGGYPSNATDPGGFYDPQTNSWAPSSIINAPNARSRDSMVWTGDKVLAWENIFQGTGTGASYDPVLDLWTDINLTNQPSPRSNPLVAWTDHGMLVWGGVFYENGNPPVGLTDGTIYDPDTDQWSSISETNTPAARTDSKAVWSGTELIIWGGIESPGFTRLNTGGRYNPTTDSWTAISTLAAPGRRSEHSLVWTGQNILVWGGDPAVNLGVYTAPSDLIFESNFDQSN